MEKEITKNIKEFAKILNPKPIPSQQAMIDIFIVTLIRFIKDKLTTQRAEILKEVEDMIYSWNNMDSKIQLYITGTAKNPEIFLREKDLLTSLKELK